MPVTAGGRNAVVDCGTNSLKLHVAERTPDGWRTVLDRAVTTRLGEDLGRTGRIGDAAVDRAAAALAGLAGEARAAGATGLVAVGTAAFRAAANGREVAAALEARTGVPVEILTGEDEARLAYLAAASRRGPIAGLVVVFDTGGGSTQVTVGRDGRVEQQISLGVGSVGLAERHGLAGPATRAAVEAATDEVAAALVPLDLPRRPGAVVGLGGAVTTLAAVALALEPYDADRIDGVRLSAGEVDAQVARYAALAAPARRVIPGMQPGREEVILAGACVVRAVLRGLDADALTVSDRGLRHGVLIDRFDR